MTTALCIIDMQEEFRHKAEKCLMGVVRQIRQAIKKRQQIIVLYYSGSGSTIPEVRSELKGYKKVKYIPKYTDDGSRQVIKAFRNTRVKNLTITGVNGCACVYDTVCGIKDQKFNLNVPKDAVGCYCRTKTQCDVFELLDEK